MNEQLLLAAVGLGGILLRHFFPGLGKYIPGGSPAPAPQPVAPSPWVPTPVTPVEPTTPAKPLTDALEWGARAKANLISVTKADRAAIGAMCEILHGLGPVPVATASDPVPSK